MGEEAIIPHQYRRYPAIVCILITKRIVLNIELYYGAIDRHKDGWFLFCFYIKLFHC